MSKEIMVETGFPPIADKNAQILILGSMPSIKSLEQQQYYAHPRNAFWPIMSELFDMEKDWSYQQRCDHLLKNKIAVWDVLKTCQRKGSLDKDIDSKSIIANDFYEFFRKHPYVQRVFFNGSKAEQVFNRNISPILNNWDGHLSFKRIPSTSPAHATKSFEQKLEDWKSSLQN